MDTKVIDFKFKVWTRKGIVTTHVKSDGNTLKLTHTNENKKDK